MRFRLCFCLLAAASVAACNRAPQPDAQTKTYALHGQVIAIDAANKTATIKHDDIKGFMSAMTMPYPVKEMTVLKGIAPGDIIDATLLVNSSGIFLTDVKKVGTAPLEKPPAPSADASPASPGVEPLKVGEPAPDAPFLDQNGRKRDFASFKGQTVVLTFIYTRCPMPTFCPLMDRNFAAIQKTLEGDPALKRVHLVSVSFDPATDTPPVLKKHASEVGANAKWWTFLTGNEDAIDRFAARFGVSVSRAADDQRSITHNLRTAILDADGRLQKLYTGNDWTPQQLLADLKPIAE